LAPAAEVKPETDGNQFLQFFNCQDHPVIVQFTETSSMPQADVLKFPKPIATASFVLSLFSLTEVLKCRMIGCLAPEVVRIA
jgi:hypothetical protein